jgi:mannan endo-1,4-beta-mannosidase
MSLSAVAEEVCPNFDTKDTARASATQDLLARLNNSPKPALGGNWGGFRTGWTKTSKPRAVGWEEQKEIIKREPLVFGFEYIDIEYIDALRFGPSYINVQKLSRDDTMKFIIEKAKQNGIITIVDHMPNFVTQPKSRDIPRKGDSWDREGNVLEEILPNGSHHAEYKLYLDKMAKYFASLRVNGEQIPILFRPFHEMNGKWFWWGDSKFFTENGENKREVVKLWRFTWNYLTHCKGLRNLIWVWSMNIDYNIPLDFRPYWPGSIYVDVIALDGYITETKTKMLESLDVFSRTYNHLAQIASEMSKPIAISEFGFNYFTKRENNFWKENFPNFLNSKKMKPCYILIWNSHYGPLGSSYLNEQEIDDDRDNFREFIFPVSTPSGQVEERFLLLEEKKY